MAGLDEGHERAEGGQDQVERDGGEGPAGSDEDADGGDDSGEHDEDGGDGDDQQSEMKGWCDGDGMYCGRGGVLGGAHAGDAVKHAVHVKERDQEEDGGEELEYDEE